MGNQVYFCHLPITAETKPEQEAQLIKLVEEQEIDLVILARYMQVLSDKSVSETHRKGDQYPPLIPAELQRWETLPSGPRQGCKTDWSNRSLCNR